MSRILTAAVSGLACMLVLAGCGADGGPRADQDRDGHDRQRPRVADEPTKPRQRPAPEATARPRDRRAPAPQTVAPDPGPNALTIERADGSGHLLRPADLGQGWSVTATGPEDGRLLSRCQVASLYDIGAERARLRDFTTGGRAEAGQAVARFVDRRSAWRAERVVAAWRDDCARQLRRRDAALGTVRHGAWLSVVEISGVDAPERELRAALRRVEATFA